MCMGWIYYSIVSFELRLIAIGANGPILVDEFRLSRSRRELRGDFCVVFEPPEESG